MITTAIDMVKDKIRAMQKMCEEKGKPLFPDYLRHIRLLKNCFDYYNISEQSRKSSQKRNTTSEKLK